MPGVTAPGIIFDFARGHLVLIELAEIFIDNIAPILIIAGIGFFAGKRLKIDATPISRILFSVLSPALVFQSIYTSQISGTELIGLIVIVAIFILVMSLLAFGIALWRKETRLNRAAMILAAICANNGNFGLPLIALAFNNEVLARAVVIFVLVTISNYSVGVFMASSGSKSPGMALMNVFGVPSVYSALLGLLLNFTDTTLPPIMAQPVHRLSQATIPMMLLLLGLQLSRSTTLTHLNLVSTGVALRLLISPFIATSLALLLGLNNVAAVAFIMQASMPVAVVTIILATEYDLDRQLSLSMILASTLLSPVTLSLLIYILRRLVPAAL
jgi:predicted permease